MYKLSIGLERALKRAFKIGLISGALFFLNNYVAFIPTQFHTFVPVLVTFLEKLERNYRENK